MTALDVELLTLPYAGQRLWDALFRYIDLINVAPYSCL
jgi:hypothetical protein